MDIETQEEIDAQIEQAERRQRRKQLAIAIYLDNRDTSEICDAYNVHRSTVWKIKNRQQGARYTKDLVGKDWDKVINGQVKHINFVKRQLRMAEEKLEEMWELCRNDPTWQKKRQLLADYEIMLRDSIKADKEKAKAEAHNKGVHPAGVEAVKPVFERPMPEELGYGDPD